MIDRNGLKLNKVYDINLTKNIDCKKENIYIENYEEFKRIYNLNFKNINYEHICKYYCKILSFLTSNIIINDDVYGYCDTKNIEKIKNLTGNLNEILKKIRYHGLDSSEEINISLHPKCYDIDKKILKEMKSFMIMEKKKLKIKEKWDI